MTTRLLVVQSHGPVVRPWVPRCIDSVRAWAEERGHIWRFEGDTLFDRLPSGVLPRTEGRGAVRADLARLLWIRDELATGAWDRVAWLDADVVVIDPGALDLAVTTTHALGREVWVEPHPSGQGHRLRRHVHNAVCVFGPDDPVLPFLIHVSRQLLERAAPDRTPPQFIGPKLLTHLHGVANFPLIETVGMASPAVLHDLAAGGGPAWNALRNAHATPLAALNLCASLVGRTVDAVPVTDALISAALDRLETMRGTRADT
ncbi:hypothetical protein F1188_02395 [Roseospira marina]|uniref:Glycosyltransferase family 77 protein n=1 Tax=Roseospira marina TaxID=140057 RepID=A0A5M6IH46_9PROT|nr:hypothetical protein [Roseospira marina]KAA5607626.1 hypothetical protein F1188_02395 [Roseospira marina]MBB4312174.1 hypothetical protein [Roseospira marina]MBB5085810.1 hypothetical protein [Roseospira marina]